MKRKYAIPNPVRIPMVAALPLVGIIQSANAKPRLSDFVRPDVGVVCFHLPGILSGLSGQRLLCHRRAANPQGRRPSLERKKITMTMENISDKKIHVQSVKLKGRSWDLPFLPYRELKRGGTIEFTMGPQPGQWGTNPRMLE